MAKKLIYWSLDRMALMIVKMLLNKFDCFIIIEGNRGLGKSTLAHHMLKKVNSAFRRIVKETGAENSPYHNWYVFKPIMQLKKPKEHQYLLYTQQQVINFYHKKHAAGIADEMINVAFNRDFWGENQKNLIKMINMNRDYGNLLIACVPQFQNLDNQIKNLCKIRITVVRRGLSVIQTQNRTIYNKDRWDSANNEKIEREWMRKGRGLPQYTKLNTFRGIMRFKALSKNEQKIYDQIKLNERNIIAPELGVKFSEDSQLPIDEMLAKKLLDGAIKNSAIVDGMAMANGILPSTLKEKVRRRLVKMGKSSAISQYYWDNRAKKEAEIDDPVVIKLE